MSNGFFILTKIIKKRESYKLRDFEINLDKIEGLGNFIEVELMSDNAELAKNRIKKGLYN